MCLHIHIYFLTLCCQFVNRKIRPLKSTSIICFSHAPSNHGAWSSTFLSQILENKLLPDFRWGPFGNHGLQHIINISTQKFTYLLGWTISKYQYSFSPIILTYKNDNFIDSTCYYPGTKQKWFEPWEKSESIHSRDDIAFTGSDLSCLSGNHEWRWVCLIEMDQSGLPFSVSKLALSFSKLL